MDAQDARQFPHENLSPETATMTLEEFLESDLEGYEYVKGELVQMPPTSVEHGDISADLFWFLSSHVRENKLGRVYTSDTDSRLANEC